MTELFKIAEYYYKNARYSQALYVYKRYMMHAPDGKYAELAMKKIKAIESGNTMQDFAPVQVEDEPSGFGMSSGGGFGADQGADDFSFDMDDSPAPAGGMPDDGGFSFGGDFDAPSGGVQTALASENGQFSGRRQSFGIR
jgi:hypothetical protein